MSTQGGPQEADGEMRVYTMADIARELDALPLETLREMEYRRGYVDGWVQAVDALHDLMFDYRLDRQAAYEVAWNHGMYGELWKWKHAARDGFKMPPAHPKPPTKK